MKNLGRYSQRSLLLIIFVTFLASSYIFAGGKTGPGELALCTNWADDTVSLVDIQTGKEMSVINVGHKPYDVKVDPTGRMAYVTNSAGGNISIIDIQAMLESDKIPVGEAPRDIDLSKDGKWAVTANSGEDTISVVDLVAKRELYKVKVGAIPYGVALAQNDQIAVITNWGENTVSVVDLKSRKEKGARIKVGSLPYTVVAPEPGDIAIVTCFGANQLFPIDLNKLEARSPVDVGKSPWGAGLSADGKSAVVANFYSGEVSFISVERKQSSGVGLASVSSGVDVKETARIKLSAMLEAPPKGAISLASDKQPLSNVVQGKAKNVAVTNDGGVAVISDLANNRLVVIDVKTKQAVRTISVGKAPYGIAFFARNGSR